MKINSTNFPTKNIYSKDTVLLAKETGSKNQYNNDIFIKNSNIKQPSFRGLFGAIFRKSDKTNQQDKSSKKIDFINDLSLGLKSVMYADIPPENLSAIMKPSEIKKVLSELKEENFRSTKENIENGIYCADLDYQTSFSSGNENVFYILENAAKFADSYYEKTGKNFTFAITDRDSVEGLQHAIRIIGSDPEKYKHLNFIPAIKISYTHEAPNSQLGYENSDLIVYGINPFSSNIINFIENNFSKRKGMIINFIKKVYNLYPEFAYSVIEFAKQNNIKYKKNLAVSNLYWRAREYAETKGDTEIKGLDMTPKDILKESYEILSGIDKLFVGSQESGYSATGTDIIKNDEVNHSIKQVFDEYSTHYDEEQGKIVSSAENIFTDLIACFDREPEKPIIAVSSPFYLSYYYEEKNPKNYNKVVEFIKSLQNDSQGMVSAFESVSPTCENDKNLNSETIDNFNNFIRNNTDLYEVGGSFSAVKQFLSAQPKIISQ